jgi:hypothetical protein
MTNEQLIEEAREAMSNLVPFGGDFDDWHDLALMTVDLADALEAATTRTEWCVRDDRLMGFVIDEDEARTLKGEFPDVDLLQRTVGPWGVVE